jgi:hypothetical protein
LTRGGRSKVIDSKTAHVPGPGAYDVAAPIYDYRGFYKNMGKKRTETEKSQSIMWD